MQQCLCSILCIEGLTTCEIPKQAYGAVQAWLAIWY